MNVLSHNSKVDGSHAKNNKTNSNPNCDTTTTVLHRSHKQKHNSHLKQKVLVTLTHPGEAATQRNPYWSTTEHSMGSKIKKERKSFLTLLCFVTFSCPPQGHMMMLLVSVSQWISARSFSWCSPEAQRNIFWTLLLLPHPQTNWNHLKSF